ncbi:hypothetical protein NPIL_54551 [Nephila pilipes]|uniref:Uncharacterized protein n=1 Tax=Nephila pilipes TaxID=299642 RepID=A0A8X6QND8_NEPPI|nr:hypothetical protein NPIL_54551 [Nephila pilipes]
MESIELGNQLLCKSKETTPIPTPVKNSKDEKGFSTPPPRNIAKNFNSMNIQSQTLLTTSDRCQNLTASSNAFSDSTTQQPIESTQKTPYPHL